MNKLEHDVKAEVMLELSKDPNIRVFKNPVGTAYAGHAIRQPTRGEIYMKGASLVTYGLAIGSHDLIGLTSVVVTQEMVGKTVALFTSIETKRERGGVIRGGQIKWFEWVLRMGGITGFANSAEKAKELIASHLKLLSVAVADTGKASCARKGGDQNGEKEAQGQAEASTAPVLTVA